MKQNLKPSSLELLLILCKICLNCDKIALQSFIKYCSRFITDNEFTKLIYASMKILVKKNCGRYHCEDWLISNLYDIYKTN